MHICSKKYFYPLKCQPRPEIPKCWVLSNDYHRTWLVRLVTSQAIHICTSYCYFQSMAAFGNVDCIIPPSRKFNLLTGAMPWVPIKSDLAVKNTSFAEHFGNAPVRQSRFICRAIPPGPLSMQSKGIYWALRNSLLNAKTQKRLWKMYSYSVSVKQLWKSLVLLITAEMAKGTCNSSTSDKESENTSLPNHDGCLFIYLFLLAPRPLQDRSLQQQ